MKAVKKIMAIALAAFIGLGIGCTVQAYAQSVEGEEKVFSAETALLTENEDTVDAVKATPEYITIDSGATVDAGKYYQSAVLNGTQYYKVTVPSDGQIIIAILRFNQSGYTLYPAVTICDANQTALKAESYVPSYGDFEGMKSFALKSGTYWIRSTGSANTAEALYYEFKAQKETTNTSKSAAKTVSPKASLGGLFPVGGSATSNWYKFTLKSAQKNVINITNYSLEGTLTVKLSGPQSYTATIAANSTTTLHMVSYSDGSETEWPKGTYYIEITKGTADNARYTVDRKAYIEAMDITVKDVTYNGKSQKPAVTVKNGSTKLKKGTDYTLSYSNNNKVGTAKVTVKGIGEYQGESTVTFKILPKNTSISKITAGKKQLTIKWKKKKDVDGYQIRYSTSKKMSKPTTVKIGKNKTVSTTIKKKLKAKTTYYVQIRTCKKVGKKTYYSKWSTAKSKKTK